ncbi:DUF4859 domain-containing protein [Galbibacter sp. EGI 63066]|uniref:DUF4859 domain-containing protein n=1 Tax=Galbibacter sp. EGI 63066 TaxID=2993559 RepID=UPI00224924F0|nr:DUF4859 domain-containing protein [Galbibacter sp. EGI 63066]MCX2678624.1 DUF4859 domain-containing protein [Galbibacter sp. EGI 63066]
MCAKNLRKLGMYQVLILITLLCFSCSDDDIVPVTESTDEEQQQTEEQESSFDPESVDTEKIYIPQEFESMDLFDESSTWFYGRSKQSEHFIVFWGSGYGENNPGSSEVSETFRVDIDDLLEKAEQFYDINVNVLKFAETGAGNSKLDDYKMMIFLYYQEEWLATGSGYDDTIGALWVSPGTSQPVGSTIAHEIGHSFQYQVHADLGGSSGFRYGFGGNGGNTFWEQTAQWQSFQSYPEQAFTSYDFSVYTENYHRHLLHELYRYSSYFIHYYWTDIHGIDFIGRLWREAQEPEDPIEAYMRITGITWAEVNEEIYDAATKFVTWDLDALRDNGSDYIGSQTFLSTTLEDGSYQVAYERCPGTTGYNVIPLNVPSTGTVVSTAFTGLVNESGFNIVANPGRAGWHYGYVALLEDGTRVYGEMNQGAENTVDFEVPADCSNLWFVVTGAPDTYKPHAWDEDETNDDQWPYKVNFTNTDLLGNVNVGDGPPQNTTFTFDISFPYDDEAYTGTTVELSSEDLSQLAQAFVMQPSEISSAMGNEITFYAEESDGTLNPETTANGYGHWFDVNGDVIGWGADATLFSEYNETDFSFSIGQYPGQTSHDTTYTIKQALVYEYEPGETVQATFVFNVTVE